MEYLAGGFASTRDQLSGERKPSWINRRSTSEFEDKGCVAKASTFNETRIIQGKHPAKAWNPSANHYPKNTLYNPSLRITVGLDIVRLIDTKLR